jgi:hypothetical protein
MAVVAGLAASGLAAGAFAQSAGTPPAWDTLVHCAQTPDEAERLACYDTAMRAAGYAPNPSAVTANRKKTFGLSMPRVRVFKHEKKEEGARSAGASAAPLEENPNQIDVTIDQIAITQPAGKVVIFTSDGQIWRQTDTTVINSMPKEGDTMSIHTEALGGYFCDVNKYQSVRCSRVK